MACFSHAGCTSEAAAKPFWSEGTKEVAIRQPQKHLVYQIWNGRPEMGMSPSKERRFQRVYFYVYIYKTPQNGNYSPHLWHDKPIYKHKDNNWNLWYFGPQLPHQKSVMKAQKMEIHRNSAWPYSAKWQRATDDLSACEVKFSHLFEIWEKSGTQILCYGGYIQSLLGSSNIPYNSNSESTRHLATLFVFRCSPLIPSKTPLKSHYIPIYWLVTPTKII